MEEDFKIRKCKNNNCFRACETGNDECEVCKNG